MLNRMGNNFQSQAVHAVFQPLRQNLLQRREESIAFKGSERKAPVATAPSVLFGKMEANAFIKEITSPLTKAIGKAFGPQILFSGEGYLKAKALEDVMQAEAHRTSLDRMA